MDETSREPRHATEAPSPWVLAHGALLAVAGNALDLACGSGRHARYLAGRGHRVLAVDHDAGALAGLAGVAGIDTLCCDLEADGWPLAGRSFDAIIVTRYLYRPALPRLVEALAPGGLLLYETFMVGNERFGRPSNPDFLLRPGELIEFAAAHGLEVLDFTEGFQADPGPAMLQAICARRRMSPTDIGA